MNEPAKLRRFDITPTRQTVYDDSGKFYDADEVDAVIAQRDAEIAELREIVEAACAETRALVEDPNIRVEPDNLAECIDKRRREFESGRKRMHAEIARLRTLARRAIGEHTAPHDCYSTGPLTGDPLADFVTCPACQLLDAVQEAQRDA